MPRLPGSGSALMDSSPPELLSPVLEGPVTVHIITPQLTKTAMIALERGLFKTVRSVSDFFGWAAANLTGPLEKDEESCGGKRVRIVSEESLATVHFFWRLREERRRVDWLECELALTHSALSSNSSSLHYVGLHLLWNTAMRPYEHANVTDSMLKQLCKLLSSNELRVQSIAAVVVWHFAQNKQTLARLPFQVAVPALLDQLRTEEEAIKQQLVISTIRQAQVDQPGMVDDVARVFLSLKGEGDQLASSIAERASTAPSSIEQLQMLQELRATATTGRTLASLRVVATGALIALLETEQGRAAFHKIRGHNAVLGLLKQPDMASGEAAHHLFLGIVSIGSTQAQMHACRVFFEHGLETLVRIITGRKPQSSGAPVTPSGRLVAASALSYCVAHSSYHTLRLLPSTFKLVDRESSASYTYAGLLGQLRAGLVGLLLPIAMFSAQADMRGLHAAKGALSMLVSMTTCMWGLAQPLFTRQEPITGSSALLAVLLRILRLAMDGRRSEAELALYKPFAPQLRSATLAFLSCLEIDPDDLEQEYVPRAPTTESEKRNAEEELGFTAAQQEWNTENKEEVAAKKLQARRRGALARHKTKAQLELKRQVLAEQKSVAKGLTVKAQGSEDESFSKIPGQVPPPPVLVTVSSRYLVKPRKRAIGQLGHVLLQRLEPMIARKPYSRSTEITCAALSALANSVKLDLIEQSGIPRLITLIAHLHSLRKGTIISPKQAEREARKAHRISLWGGISEDLPKEEVAPQQQTYFLNGSCAMTHAYLCYSLLVLVKAVSTRGGLVGDEKATLNRSALQVLLEALDASAGGALHATATMWRLANAGYAEHLCSTGAIPALKATLKTCLDRERSYFSETGSRIALSYASEINHKTATWATCALWRLMHCRGSTNEAASCGAIQVLLEAMEWKERNEHCEAMRRAAVACISMMFQTVDLLGLLAEANAPSRLQQLVSNPTRQVVSRRSALLALEVWDKTARLDNPAAGDNETSKQATTQLQQLVTMLLSDKSLEMRALACRICSRLSCAGYQSGLVELGVPKLLLSQIEDNISKLFEAARSANAEVATSQTSCERPSMPSTPVFMPRTSASMPQTPASMPRSPPSIPRTPTSMPRASLTTCAKRASSGRGVKFHRGSLDASSAMGFSASEAQVKHVQSLGLPACVEQLGFVEKDFEPGSLFYDALNSLVNLSAARCTQPAIARHGLWRLLQLRYASDGLAERVRKPPRPATPSEDDAREREELSQVPINRLSDIAGMVGSILAAICTHTANLSVMYRAELQLKAAILGGKVHFDADRRLGSSASEPLLQRMHRDSFVTRDGVSSSLDPPATPSSTKLRYMHWLHQVTEEERSIHRSDADRPWLVQRLKAPKSATKASPTRRPKHSVARGARELLRELAIPKASIPTISPRSPAANADILRSSDSASGLSRKQAATNLDTLMRRSRSQTWKLSLREQLHKAQLEKQNRLKTPRLDENDGSSPRGGVVSPTTPRASVVSPRVGSPQRSSRATNDTSPPRSGNSTPRKSGTYVAAEGDAKLISALLQPPIPECSDPLPDSLEILGLEAWPRRPAPPRLLPHDVPSPFNTATVAAFREGKDRAAAPTKQELGMKVEERDQAALVNPLPSDSCEVRPLVIHATELIEALVVPPVGAMQKASASTVGVSQKSNPPTVGENGKFDLLRSLFTHRIYTSDASSFFTTDEVFERAFNIDFCRANNQKFREEAGVDSDPQLQHRLYAALKQHRFLLFSLFAFYSAADGALSTMSVKAYLALWTKCNVVDESLTNDALISIFFQAHQEQEPVENKRRRSVAKASDKDKVTLSRFMFLRSVVLVARQKFAQAKNDHGKAIDEVACCDELISKHLNYSCPPGAKVSPDGFRRKRLYTAETHSVLLAHDNTLQLIFNAFADEHSKDVVMNQVASASYAACPTIFQIDSQHTGFDRTNSQLTGLDRTDSQLTANSQLTGFRRINSQMTGFERTSSQLTAFERTTSQLSHLDRANSQLMGSDSSLLTFRQADERMNLEGWLELLESCNLLDSEDNKTGPGLLDMDEATWCFIWSQDFVSDEVLRARAMQQLTFVGFMEALCRITMFIRLPDESSFAAYSASSIEDLYVKVANSAEEGEALHPAPKLDWQAEERSSAPINEAVDTLLRLMVCRLTQGASGLSIESIASRRDRLHAKKRKKAQKMAVKIDKQQAHCSYNRTKPISSATIGSPEQSFRSSFPTVSPVRASSEPPSLDHSATLIQSPSRSKSQRPSAEKPAGLLPLIESCSSLPPIT